MSVHSTVAPAACRTRALVAHPSAARGARASPRRSRAASREESAIGASHGSCCAASSSGAHAACRRCSSRGRWRQERCLEHPSGLRSGLCPRRRDYGRDYEGLWTRGEAEASRRWRASPPWSVARRRCARRGVPCASARAAAAVAPPRLRPSPHRRARLSPQAHRRHPDRLRAAAAPAGTPPLAAAPRDSQGAMDVRLGSTKAWDSSLAMAGPPTRSDQVLAPSETPVQVPSAPSARWPAHGGRGPALATPMVRPQALASAGTRAQRVGLQGPA